MKKHKKSSLVLLVIMVFMMVFPPTVHATGAGGVSTAIESTWKDAAKQIKDVTNKVIFPTADLILAIFLLSWQPALLTIKSTALLNL